jgi:microsomal dipeptidase-like Zn-dependent dipeptidase
MEMMKLGMLIDIDHMSDKSQRDTLEMAERNNNDYPVNIGHNGVQTSRKSERIASIDIVKRVAKLGGLFGVGTTDSEEHHTDSPEFIHSFIKVWQTMSTDGSQPRVAIGSDVNGMERLPAAPTGLDSNTFYQNFPKSMTGDKTWDYTKDGVAHYGLMADFMKDVKAKNSTVYDRLMDSAEYFALMWEKIERQKLTVR